MKKIVPTKVLFVCLGNACRSPMAEAIALRDAPDVIEPSSAGLTPLGRIEPMTKETLAKNGFSSDELWSKTLLATAQNGGYCDQYERASEGCSVQGRGQCRKLGGARSVWRGCRALSENL